MVFTNVAAPTGIKSGTNIELIKFENVFSCTPKQEFFTPLLLPLVLILFGCGIPEERNANKKPDAVEDPRQLSFEEKKKLSLDVEPYDDTQQLVFDAIEKSTAESIKEPKMIYANLDRSFPELPMLDAEWVGDSASYVDEVCVQLSNGEVLTYNCSQVREQHEEFLAFGFERSRNWMPRRCLERWFT